MNSAHQRANAVRPYDRVTRVRASGGRPMAGDGRCVMAINGATNNATNGANAVCPYDRVTRVGASGGRPREVDGDE
jgi:hypothetical protein